MRALESQWWIIELPEEWQAEQDDETILISDEDGVGEIAITTLQKQEGEVTVEELAEYTRDVESQFGKGEPVSIADLAGSYFNYKEEGDNVREWYLHGNNLLVLITYSCDEDNAGMDDAAVNDILSTLFIKIEEDS